MMMMMMMMKKKKKKKKKKKMTKTKMNLRNHRTITEFHGLTARLNASSARPANVDTPGIQRNGEIHAEVSIAMRVPPIAGWFIVEYPKKRLDDDWDDWV